MAMLDVLAHRTVQAQATIFACIFGTLFLARSTLTPLSDSTSPQARFQRNTWLLSKEEAPAKRATEQWFLAYGVFWIACFGVIVGGQLYVWFDKIHYIVVCGGLAAPLLLQPVLLPSVTCDQGKPLLQRHSFKANLWLLIFGFVGNYWYTHYFYTVLKASYTMPSWDLNGVCDHLIINLFDV